jgi:hypothetical protein
METAGNLNIVERGGVGAWGRWGAVQGNHHPLQPGSQSAVEISLGISL